MPALVELERRGSRPARDPAFRAELDALLRDYVGRPVAALPRRAAVGGRRPRRLPQARGPQPHRRAQDQQRARPVPARQAHGQDADHRRDRRRPARRGHRHRVRAARPRVHRLHGHRGHAPPAPERRSGWSCWARRVAPVDAGARTLKEAVSAAIRDWVANVGATHYVHRLLRRPAPYPGARARPPAGDRRRGARAAARAGRAAARPRRRLRRRRLERDRHRSSRSSTTRRSALSASRPAGDGIETGRHGAPLTVGGRGGVLHGAYSAIMQDEDGQILEAHSISAGLDYPGVGPEHAWLRDSGRARYVGVTDAEALEAFQRADAAGGHHPGARVLARARLAARLARGRRERRPRLPVRARRQGPGRGPGEARRGMTTGAERIAAAFAAAPRPRGADAVPDGRLPGRRGVRRRRHRLRRRRRRPGRARRAVLRPAGRRPGDPRRGHPRRSPTAPPCHAVLEAGARIAERVPVVLMCYANPLLARGTRALRRRARRARHQRPDRARPAARGVGRRARRVRRRRRSRSCRSSRRPRRTRGWPSIGASARGFVYTVSVTGTTGERAPFED